MNYKENQLTAAEELTQLLIKQIENKKLSDHNTFYSIAISGGNSPEALFELWTGKYRNLIDWDMILLFWADERVVHPDNPESNYGNAKKMLLDKIPLRSERVYRIFGEADPVTESERYSNLLLNLLPVNNGFPVFDMIILGLGEDGHTASIFPGQSHLLDNQRPYAKSVNPYSGQSRITVTGNTIRYSSKSLYYIKGESKQVAVDMLNRMYDNADYPAAWLTRYMSEPYIFRDR